MTIYIYICYIHRRTVFVGWIPHKAIHEELEEDAEEAEEAKEAEEENDAWWVLSITWFVWFPEVWRWIYDNDDDDDDDDDEEEEEYHDEIEYMSIMMSFFGVSNSFI